MSNLPEQPNYGFYPNVDPLSDQKRIPIPGGEKLVIPIEDNLLIPSRGGLVLPPEEYRRRMLENPLDPMLNHRELELAQNFEGFPEMWVNSIRLALLNPDKAPQFVVLVGPTGSGKKTLAGQILRLGQIDPYLEGKNLRLSYLSFAASADSMEPQGFFISPGHGRYSEKEYRLSSQRLSGYIGQAMNAWDRPTLVVVEISSPTAYWDPEEGIVGPDRGYSAGRTLAKFNPDNSFFIGVVRSEELKQAIIDFRTKLKRSNARTFIKVLSEAHTTLYSEDEIEDIAALSLRDRRLLRANLLAGGAPAEGILRSSMELRNRMKMLKEQGLLESEEDEEMFFRWLITEDWGIKDESRYLVAENKMRYGTVTLHERLLERNDPIRLYTSQLDQKRKIIRDKNPKFRRQLRETIASDKRRIDVM